MQASRKKWKVPTARVQANAMKTVVAGAMAILVVALVLGMADGGKDRTKRLHEKWALMRVALERMAQGRDDGEQHLKYDDFYDCVNVYGATDDDMEEYFGNPTSENSSLLMQCIAGCYFQWAKLIVDRELDKTRMGGLLEIFGVDHEDADDAADACQADIAEVPRETCNLGAAVDDCLRKLLAKVNVGAKRRDRKAKSASASERKPSYFE